jgi:hypothetical protein
MRSSLFALSFVAANLIAGLVPAMAQDDDPAKPPPRHHLAPPRAIRDLRIAAIQAPPPKPRPAAPASSSSGSPLSQTVAQQNPAAVLQQFTLTDLQAALADALAQNPPDTIAGNCYQELVTVVQSPAINPLPTGPGAFQLFQKARDLKNIVSALQSNNGPLTALNVACAPLVIDVQTTLIRLGVIGGAVAATGGLLPIPLP